MDLFPIADPAVAANPETAVLRRPPVQGLLGFLGEVVLPYARIDEIPGQFVGDGAILERPVDREAGLLQRLLPQVEAEAFAPPIKPAA